MDNATAFAVMAAVVYAVGTLAVGLWIFWGDVFLLGAVVFIAVVLVPPCFFVTRSAMRAQLADSNQ